jgi:hypothetical protein
MAKLDWEKANKKGSGRGTSAEEIASKSRLVRNKSGKTQMVRADELLVKRRSEKDVTFVAESLRLREEDNSRRRHFAQLKQSLENRLENLKRKLAGAKREIARLEQKRVQVIQPDKKQKAKCRPNKNVSTGRQIHQLQLNMQPLKQKIANTEREIARLDKLSLSVK